MFTLGFTLWTTERYFVTSDQGIFMGVQSLRFSWRITFNVQGNWENIYHFIKQTANRNLLKYIFEKNQILSIIGRNICLQRKSCLLVWMNIFISTCRIKQIVIFQFCWCDTLNFKITFCLETDQILDSPSYPQFCLHRLFFIILSS